LITARATRVEVEDGLRFALHQRPGSRGWTISEPGLPTTDDTKPLDPFEATAWLRPWTNACSLRLFLKPARTSLPADRCPTTRVRAPLGGPGSHGFQLPPDAGAPQPSVRRYRNRRTAILPRPLSSQARLPAIRRPKQAQGDRNPAIGSQGAFKPIQSSSNRRPVRRGARVLFNPRKGIAGKDSRVQHQPGRLS
jgi:hypothetical protein